MKKRIELYVGLFVVIGMIILGYMIIRLGSEDYFAYKDALRFSVHFNFADGLLEKAPVRYAGVDIGRVEGIRLTSNPKQRVILDLVVTKDVEIREKDYITINSLGLMSEMYVEIIPRDQTSNVIKEKSILKGNDPVALQQVVSNAKQVLEELEKGVKIFSEEETKDNIKYSLKNIRELSEEVKSVNANMQETTQILRDLFVSNKDNINESISEFTQNIKGMRKSVDSMERVMARMERGEGLIGKLLVDKKTSDDFSELLEKTKIVMTDLHEINVNIMEGKGSLGMFIYDEEVSGKLKDLIIEIEKNPWKLMRKSKKK